MSRELLTPQVLRSMETNKLHFVGEDNKGLSEDSICGQRRTQLHCPSISERADAAKQLQEGFGYMGVASLIDILKKRFW